MNTRRITVIDCQTAGVSGDMFLGALLDLGADIDKTVNNIKSLEEFFEGCGKIEVRVKDVMRMGFKAKKIDVAAKEIREVKAVKILKAVEKCVQHLKLSLKAKRFASSVTRTLLEAEAELHGRSMEKAHLHEAGQVDTPAEIIGVTTALEDLEIFNSKVYSTSAAVGGGLFKFSHGLVSSPAPATLEILRSKNFPIIGGPIEYELTTPTGASILVNLVDEFSLFYPTMKPLKVGYGAGADLKELANVMRIILGEPTDYGLSKSEVVVLETNLDDVAGEVVGYVMDRLFLEGARDVSVIPMFTKKNRPGHIMKVIVNREDAERLSRLLMEETGSLGVRMLLCERRILVRKSVALKIKVGSLRETVRVKVAKDRENMVIRIKPEYDDVRILAEKTGKPLQEIMNLVMVEARKKVRGGEN